MTPHIAFRVDAGLQIGTGHVIRCLVLADELRLFGAESSFICRPHQGHMADCIAARGHRVALLNLPHSARSLDEDSPYADWRGASWPEDARETVAVLRERPASWLVADHYALDARWENAVRNGARLKVMAIDGQVNRPHDCELLLDPTYSAEGERRWQGMVSPSCRLLVGPQYALLRPEFAIALAAAPRNEGKARRVVIAFGGVDKINATNVALEALRDESFLQIGVDVIVGASNPHYDSLAAASAGADNIRLHRQPPNVGALMAAADIGVSAGGTMLLEQCYVHVPALVVSVADNQIGLCKALAGAGSIEYLGHLKDGNRLQMQAAISAALNCLLQDDARLVQMRDRCRELMRRADMSAASLLME